MFLLSNIIILGSLNIIYFLLNSFTNATCPITPPCSPITEDIYSLPSCNAANSPSYPLISTAKSFIIQKKSQPILVDSLCTIFYRSIIANIRLGLFLLQNPGFLHFATEITFCFIKFFPCQQSNDNAWWYI